ncbi:MAG: hypothetical protein R8K47_00620 [Mariprofundaceae bacterium]
MSGIAGLMEDVRRENDLRFVLAVNEDGMAVAQAGAVSSDALAAYAPMALETARRMSDAGGLGDPLCSALVLRDGSMLIMADAEVAGRGMYLMLHCARPPAGLRALLDRIEAALNQALGAAKEVGA